jgi:hypothetical protein
MSKKVLHEPKPFLRNRGERGSKVYYICAQNQRPLGVLQEVHPEPDTMNGLVQCPTWAATGDFIHRYVPGYDDGGSERGVRSGGRTPRERDEAELLESIESLSSFENVESLEHEFVLQVLDVQPV